MTTKHGKEGAALVVALVFLAIVAAMTSAFFMVVQQAIKAEEDAYWKVVAQSLAEAGVEKAATTLQTAGTQYSGEADTLLGDQKQCARTFSTEVRPGLKAGTYEIRATGTVRNDLVLIKQVHVEVLLEPGAAGRLRVARWKEM